MNERNKQHLEVEGVTYLSLFGSVAYWLCPHSCAMASVTHENARVFR